jgi:hypothetical protein
MKSTPAPRAGVLLFIKQNNRVDKAAGGNLPMIIQGIYNSPAAGVLLFTIGELYQ